MCVGVGVQALGPPGARFPGQVQGGVGGEEATHQHTGAQARWSLTVTEILVQEEEGQVEGLVQGGRVTGKVWPRGKQAPETLVR